ncbi:MAG: tRNA (adenosine(37)-N6)-threonylcarbamoyltransferase complex dimerization subunit type 1 TsaB [Phycisphaerales bacterium]
MPGRFILAIETSQRQGSVATLDEAGVVTQRILHSRTRHDNALMPTVDELMHALNAQPRDLKAVAISVGPGSFSGIRIGIATAMMLCESLEIPAIAIPSAMVAAQATIGEGRNVNQAAVVLACKGETAWMTHVFRDESSGRWTIRGNAGLMAATALAETDVATVLADEHLPADYRKWCTSHEVPIIPMTFDAAACATLAGFEWQDGTVIADPAQLHPLYPRGPEAVALFEKRQQKM